MKRAEQQLEAEQPIDCPRCASPVMAADLDEHAERCTQRRPPAPLRARWLPRARALSVVSRAALARWEQHGLVRVRHDGYVLERDLVQAVSWARALGAAWRSVAAATPAPWPVCHRTAASARDHSPRVSTRMH